MMPELTDDLQQSHKTPTIKRGLNRSQLGDEELGLDYVRNPSQIDLTDASRNAVP